VRCEDGAKDGLIQDPTKCNFDAAAVECKGADTANCLTRPQVDAARKIYSPARNSRTGEYLLAGLMPGSELGWGVMAGAQPFPYAVDFFKYLVFKDPNWDYNKRPVNFDSDVAAKMGTKAKNSVRLFMVPGMGHCPGGNGPSTFDLDTIAILDKWKSTGQAPEQANAQHRTNGQPDRKILVCAYPNVAIYKGSGSFDEPTNFRCATEN
jgi:feruloyl esterase